MNSFDADDIQISDLLPKEVVNDRCEVVAIGTIVGIQMDGAMDVQIELHVD